LFKTRDYSRTKNNLMIFIRPKILHTAEQTAIETGAKYNYMLDEQRRADKRDSTPLLHGEKPPTLPPLTEIPAPEDSVGPQPSKPEVSNTVPSNPAAPSAEKSESAQPPQESH
jgi:hypothetical protein